MKFIPIEQHKAKPFRLPIWFVVCVGVMALWAAVLATGLYFAIECISRQFQGMS